MGLATCGNNTKPQIPTYHNGKTVTQDSALLTMLRVNEQMSAEADRQVLNYANGYSQWENGMWTRGYSNGKPMLREDESVMLGLRIFDLRDSTLLEDIRETVQVGKYERMEALATLLPELHRGDSLSLLVPWYLAYGATGNEHVAPYSNVRIEIIVEK